MPTPPPPIAVLPHNEPVTRRRYSFGFGGFSQVVFSRPLGFVALFGLFLGAFILPPTGVSFSPCGFHTSTGLPCVGCGLTRSVTSFLQGHVALSWTYHPFGPAFALGFVALGVISVLPNRFRDSLLARLERWDWHLGISTIAFFALLIAYGLLRISLVAGGNPDLQWWKSADAPPLVTQQGGSEP